MKCSLCKYKNAVAEAIRHPNGITVHTVISLGSRLRENRHRLCDEHKGDNYAVALSEIGKTLSTSTLLYTPIENIWHEPIYMPRAERV